MSSLVLVEEGDYLWQKGNLKPFSLKLEGNLGIIDQSAIDSLTVLDMCEWKKKKGSCF